MAERRPNFGASIQMLKARGPLKSAKLHATNERSAVWTWAEVEIGGDSQSTDGTEPSHMHTKDDLALASLQPHFC